VQLGESDEHVSQALMIIYCRMHELALKNWSLRG